MADGVRPAIPADWTSLQAEIKAEVQRRNQSGSVAPYGGTDYDYNVVPAPDTPIRGEHLQKVLEPMKAINPDGLPEYPGELKQSDVEAMETKVAAWKTRGMTDRSASDCKTGCTGTCYSGCSTGCYTTCSGDCTGCGSGCVTGCSGCSGTCSGTCRADCASNCYQLCNNDCTGCGGTCSGGCQGCGGSCFWGYCTSWCATTAVAAQDGKYS